MAAEMTVQQTRTGIAALLHERRQPHAVRTIRRRLERKTLARFYHWRAAGLLAPCRTAA